MLIENKLKLRSIGVFFGYQEFRDAFMTTGSISLIVDTRMRRRNEDTQVTSRKRNVEKNHPPIVYVSFVNISQGSKIRCSGREIYQTGWWIARVYVAIIRQPWNQSRTLHSHRIAMSFPQMQPILSSRRRAKWYRCKYNTMGIGLLTRSPVSILTFTYWTSCQ